VPSPVGGLGACLQKKNQFCAKNHAILSKFWYFFPILQQKVGDYPPVLKGDLSPCPPCSDAYGIRTAEYNRFARSLRLVAAIERAS